MASSSFAFWNFLWFFLKIFLIQAWLNPQMWNQWDIFNPWRAECNTSHMTNILVFVFQTGDCWRCFPVFLYQNYKCPLREAAFPSCTWERETPLWAAVTGLLRLSAAPSAGVKEQHSLGAGRLPLCDPGKCCGHRGWESPGIPFPRNHSGDTLCANWRNRAEHSATSPHRGSRRPPCRQGVQHSPPVFDTPSCSHF